ncbi:DUF3466 family protein [Azohydromonas australica]|uniref:DUF3466 family protein n=1 Tax=Azohydromonas australica TaxID=364039 RepID=UPI00042A5F09|nr:DUF3466 family protein [Azohydromonas australica]
MTAALALATMQAQAQPQLRYRVEALTYDGPVTDDEYFSAFGLNNRGVVVGTRQTEIEHEWVELIGTAHISQGNHLEPLPGSDAFHDSSAVGINDRGQVIGQYRSNGVGGQIPYLYTQGRYRDLRVENVSGWDYARDINAAGQVVGRANGQAFLFDGTRSRYLDIPGAVGSIAEGVNDQGVMVGNALFDAPGDGLEDRAFVHDGHGVKFLQNPLQDFQTAQMADINNVGQMAAHIFNPDGQRYRSFLYEADGRFTELASLHGRQERTIVQGLNDRGWAVGLSSGDTCNEYTCDEAVLWRDGQTLSLNDLLSPAQAELWQLTDAVAINERGQIAGNGYYLSSYVGFVLTPVPEAQSWALLLAGLGVVGTLARRRAAGRG